MTRNWRFQRSTDTPSLYRILANFAFLILTSVTGLVYASLIWSQLNYGLEYDESFMLNVIRNIGNGSGFVGDGVSFWSTSRPFDPNISTGPVVLLPAALVWKLSEGSLTVTRLVPVCFFIVYLASIASIFYRWRGRWAAVAALAGPLVLPILHPDLANRSLMPGRLVGEIAATSMLVLAALLLGHRKYLLAGLAGGMAIQAKLNFALPVVALLATCCLAYWVARKGIPGALVPKYVAGVVIPTIVFEIFKLLTLGLPDYKASLTLMLRFTDAQSLNLSEIPISTLVKSVALTKFMSGPLIVISVALLATLILYFFLTPILKPDKAEQVTVTVGFDNTVTILGLATAGLAIAFWWLLTSSQLSPRPAVPFLLIFLPILTATLFVLAGDLLVRTTGRLHLLMTFVALAAYTILALSVSYQGVRIARNESGRELLRDQINAASIIERETVELPIDDFWTNPEFSVLTDLPFQEDRKASPKLLVFTSLRALLEFGTPDARLYESECGDILYRSTNVVVCRPLAR